MSFKDNPKISIADRLERLKLNDVRTTLTAFSDLERGKTDLIFDATGLIDDDGTPENIAKRVTRENLGQYRNGYLIRHAASVTKLLETDAKEVHLTPCNSTDFSRPDTVKFEFFHTAVGFGTIGNFYEDDFSEPSSRIVFDDVSRIPERPTVLTTPDAIYSPYDAVLAIQYAASVLRDTVARRSVA